MVFRRCEGALPVFFLEIAVAAIVLVLVLALLIRVIIPWFSRRMRAEALQDATRDQWGDHTGVDSDLIRWQTKQAEETRLRPPSGY